MRIDRQPFCSDVLHLTWRDLWLLLMGRRLVASGLIVTTEKERKK